MHRSQLRRGIHWNRYLQRAWCKYGEESFSFTILEIVGDVSAVVRREQCWLDKSRVTGNVYNFGDSADNPMRGRTHSDEARRKISEAHSGRTFTDEHKRRIGESQRGTKSHNYGKKASAATRRKMSDAHTGKKIGPPSENTRRKISEALKGKPGRPHTEETRQKIGAASAKPYPAFCHLETGETILAGHNLTAMCREHNLSQQHMWDIHTWQPS